jgi:hypothetical protein
MSGRSRLDQGLPALRQVQAGVRDPRAARQPAVFAAQQDSRHLAADRSLPLRRTDAARRFAAPFRRIQRRCRPLHGVPQVRNPCPVDIDFGDVSIAMRNFLRKQGKRKFNPGTAAAMAFLNATDPATIKALRVAMMGIGYKAQRSVTTVRQGARPDRLGRRRIRRPRWEAADQVAGHPLHQQADAGQVPKRTSRALLDIEDAKPWCRSSAIRNGRRRTGSGVLLPRLRLGTPVLAGRSGHAGHALSRRRADRAAAGLPVLRLPADIRRRCGKGPADQHVNRVLFHRVANTLNYLDIKTVIVSCGTCMDQLQKYEFDKIFPGCRLLDIHEYLMEKGVKLEGVQGVRYMYHDPCHTPMKTHNADEGGQPADRHSRRWVTLTSAAAAKRHARRFPARTFRPRCASARKRKCARVPARCAPSGRSPAT